MKTRVFSLGAGGPSMCSSCLLTIQAGILMTRKNRGDTRSVDYSPNTGCMGCILTVFTV